MAGRRSGSDEPQSGEVNADLLANLSFQGIGRLLAGIQEAAWKSPTTSRPQYMIEQEYLLMFVYDDDRDGNSKFGLSGSDDPCSH